MRFIKQGGLILGIVALCAIFSVWVHIDRDWHTFANAAQISKWNGYTLGTGTASIKAWNGKTLGTASGNVNAINGDTLYLGAAYTDIYISSATHDFGTITVGAYTGTWMYTVTNAHATQTYLFQSLTFTGTNATDFSSASNNCTGFITPSGTCVGVINFNPYTTGSRAGTFQLPYTSTWSASLAAGTATLAFGTVTYTATSALPNTMTAGATTSVYPGSVTCDATIATYYAGSITTGALAAGGTRVATITFTPNNTATAQAHNGNCYVSFTW